MTGRFSPADIPVDPSAPDAQQWLRDELAKAPYQAARPTWFDRLSQAFFDWLGSLTAPSGDGFIAWVPLIITVLVVGVVVAAFLIFGLPRLNRRSRLAAELFGDDDRRTADDMRRAGQAAAQRGDWGPAIEELFRAIARGLVERTVLTVTPGTTSHEFALRAAVAFPAERGRLAEAALAFDQVRYLGRSGTEQGYRALSELDRALATAQPAVFAAPDGMSSR
ncbi:DUF4129 domain-containing protein [Glaciibacter sp. 2TAF33]|uniref:DUF4129 domain-containing protein n=1 Tax=Glaciibacter sp. 2TAF33 TaxID=3233015 RepID=UPI003F924E56